MSRQFSVSDLSDDELNQEYNDRLNDLRNAIFDGVSPEDMVRVVRLVDALSVVALEILVRRSR